MIRPTRAVAWTARLPPPTQWQRFASSSPPSLRQSPKLKAQPSSKQLRPPLPKAPAIRPYKPTSHKHDKATSPDARSATTPSPDTLQSLWRRSWLPLTGAALISGFLGFYIFGTAAASLKTPPCPGSGCEYDRPTGRPPALSGDNADQFDKELDFGEWWMGITRLRRKLAERADGHVLELAMGTGRNLEHYNWQPLSAAAGGGVAPQGILSFTGLDISVDMLEVARKRLAETIPPMASSAPSVGASTMADHAGGELAFLGGRLRLVNSDAHGAIPPPAAGGPNAKYDTIVQTFGLCSVSDPVGVLSNLASAIKPGTGRIILLEHGKGWYGIVNGLLDKNAGKHFEKYGCWWNRDIEALVDEAVQRTPGLELVKLSRPIMLQMGTLVWIELRVADRP
ncbi:hypothetical protein RJ55_00733 [Drechmeria coniospora]|nr:hypothetical protein RJ55_00733 [Drechmeria coniospora]